MDRLQSMAVYVAVAEAGGFAAAARRLKVSPPSTTRAVAELEARLQALEGDSSSPPPAEP